MADISRAVDVAESVVGTVDIVDRCGPVAEATAKRLRASGVVTRRESAVVYGWFQHPSMSDRVPHAWVVFRASRDRGDDTVLLDPTLKQFESGYAPVERQVATVDATFSAVGVFGEGEQEADWYVPHPREMNWPHDGTPIVSQDM